MSIVGVVKEIITNVIIFCVFLFSTLTSIYVNLQHSLIFSVHMY